MKWSHKQCAQALLKSRSLDTAFQNMDADNSDLRAFQQTGNKIMVYHGLADPGVAPQSAVNYYQASCKYTGGLEKTQEFHRLFLTLVWGNVSAVAVLLEMQQFQYLLLKRCSTCSHAGSRRMKHQILFTQHQWMGKLADRYVFIPGSQSTMVLGMSILHQVLSVDLAFVLDLAFGGWKGHMLSTIIYHLRIYEFGILQQYLTTFAINIGVNIILWCL
jgi:hypothetical protein